MKVAKFSFKSMILTDIASILFAMFPALLCSLGVYGMLITQIEEPGSNEHLIMAAIGLVPSMILYLVLLKMESSRKAKEQSRRDHRRVRRYGRRLQEFQHRLLYAQWQKPGNHVVVMLAQYTNQYPLNIR